MTDTMKVLFAGDRAWMNRAPIIKILKELPPGTIIVHGACPTGADKIVDEEARRLQPEKGFVIRPYPAPWDEFEAKGNRNSAGPARNSEMLRREHPDKDGVPIHQGFAFSGNLDRSRGTRDITLKARAKGIKVDVVAG
jgi:hypothetical protein